MRNGQPEILFVGSREARTFPKSWQHPQDARGRYVPLLPADYRFDDSQEPSPTMPSPDGETEIAAYETVSEGTPISPAFPNTPPRPAPLLRGALPAVRHPQDRRRGVGRDPLRRRGHHA